jgi:DNA-binding LacI/PurR family transcriptional regulator
VAEKVNGPRRTTLRDVAAAAGVSVQTVSNLVNGRTHLMSEGTRGRVQEAMTSLDYRPNATARSLRAGGTKTLGFLVLDEDARFLADPMTDLIMGGIGDVARERGYGLLIQAARPGEPDSGLLTPLVEHRVDGAMLLLSGSKATRRTYTKRVAALGYPAVLFEEQRQAPDGVLSVTAANRDGSRTLASYLLDRGHERIAFIAAAVPWPMIEQRHAGYLDALKARGIEPVEELQMFRGGWDPASGETMAESLLSLKEPPTAIMAGNDLLAVGALRAARMRGLKIPGQLAVAGFNNFQFSAFVEPALSTVAIPAYDMGEAAATMLIDQLEGGQPQSKQFPVELVLRGST